MAKVKFTTGRIDAFECSPDKSSAFLWDSVAPGLGLRVTLNGSKSFIFQAKLKGQVIRTTIGSPKTWTIADAQAEARRLKVIIDNGEDPRQVRTDELVAKQTERDTRDAEAEKARTEAQRQQVTLGEVWPIYIEARRHKWSEGHLRNHITLAAKGGEKKKRGKGKTVPGPLAALMPLALVDLTPERITAWLDKETASRATNAAQSYRILRAFIRWTADMPAYRGIIGTEAYSASSVREAVPKNKAADGDGLQREQLKDWFAAMQKIHNPVIRIYLQGLLLTGARREELATLQWDDVDFQWRSLKIKDKVEGSRIIPLTPYFASLLRDLKRRNDTPPTIRRIRTLKSRGIEWEPSPWVFSSTTSESGHIAEPRIAHTDALIGAGLPHVSLHGLRRSFGTLCEWVEVPSGVSAQIMGHKPSALAEKHYRRRPLDLLRKFHDQIEAWMLEQAEIKFSPESSTGVVLRVVAN